MCILCLFTIFELASCSVEWSLPRMTFSNMIWLSQRFIPICDSLYQDYVGHIHSVRCIWYTRCFNFHFLSYVVISDWRKKKQYMFCVAAFGISDSSRSLHWRPNSAGRWVGVSALYPFLLACCAKNTYLCIVIHILPPDVRYMHHGM